MYNLYRQNSDLIDDWEGVWIGLKVGQTYFLKSVLFTSESFDKYKKK